MKKVFIPKDGRPAIPVSSIEDIKEYMGDIINEFGPIELQGDLVLTQIQGQYIKIGELK